MKCPACNDELNRTTYEDVPVFECPSCGGYLVGRTQMMLIKSTRDVAPDQLRADAESGEDSPEPIRCPKCLEQRMRKQRVAGYEDETFQIDACGKCNVVWFDAGELAKMQIHYEESAQGVEALARQERAAALAEGGDREFEKDLAALPQHQSFLTKGLRDVLIQVSAVVLGVAAVLLAIFDFDRSAAATSIPAVILIGWALIGLSNTTAGRWAIVLIIALVETGFLVWTLY